MQTNPIPECDAVKRSKQEFEVYLQTLIRTSLLSVINESSESAQVIIGHPWGHNWMKFVECLAALLGLDFVHNPGSPSYIFDHEYLCKHYWEFGLSHVEAVSERISKTNYKMEFVRIDESQSHGYVLLFSRIPLPSLYDLCCLKVADVIFDKLRCDNLIAKSTQDEEDVYYVPRRGWEHCVVAIFDVLPRHLIHPIVSSLILNETWKKKMEKKTLRQFAESFKPCNDCKEIFSQYDLVWSTDKFLSNGYLESTFKRLFCLWRNKESDSDSSDSDFDFGGCNKKEVVDKKISQGAYFINTGSFYEFLVVNGVPFKYLLGGNKTRQSYIEKHGVPIVAHKNHKNTVRWICWDCFGKPFAEVLNRIIKE